MSCNKTLIEPKLLNIGFASRYFHVMVSVNGLFLLLIDYRNAPDISLPAWGCIFIPYNLWSSKHLGHLLSRLRKVMCRSLSPCTRVSIGGMILGFLLQIVGLSMPHWCDSTPQHTKRMNFGLWKTCEDIGRSDEHVPICQFSLNGKLYIDFLKCNMILLTRMYILKKIMDLFPNPFATMVTIILFVYVIIMQ